MKTHLYNLWVIEPLAEYCLYESKNLLQNHHHLKHKNNNFSYFNKEKQSNKEHQKLS